MTSARDHAVADAGQAGLAAPVTVTLDFHGPCSLGGSVGVAGTVEAGGMPSHSAVDLRFAFDDCEEALGTVDGDLRVKSDVTSGTVEEEMHGSIDFSSPSVSASCDLDVVMSVNPAGVHYAGSVCGFDAEVDVTR